MGKLRFVNFIAKTSIRRMEMSAEKKIPYTEKKEVRIKLEEKKMETDVEKNFADKQFFELLGRGIRHQSSDIILTDHL